MGWAEIKKAINSNLNKPLDTLIQEKYTETTANITSCKDILYAHTSGVRDTVNAIYGTVVTGNKSVIKSIQSGVTREKVITHAPVNVDKSFVIIHGFAVEFSKTYALLATHRTANTITVKSQWNQEEQAPFSLDYSWQLIEFY